MIELSAADGHTFAAYRAEPAETPKGAVVVVQEKFGVTAHIRKLADAFAARGYTAIAPSLFDRAKPDVALAYDETAASEGEALASQVGTAGALADIQAAVDAVKGTGKVAIVGYDWGGYLSYVAGNYVDGLACAIGYYGDGIVEDFREKRRIPTLLHFGESDAEIPFENVTQFRQYRPDVSAFAYPAGHGFNCDERDGFDAPAAGAALARTLFWISQYVEGQAPILLKNAGSYVAAKVEKKKKKAGDDMGPPMD